MNNKQKTIILYSLFSVLCFLFFVWWGIYLPKDSSLPEEKLFSVESGQSLFHIGENLEKEDLIKHKFFFDFYIFIKGGQGKLQAGEYYLSPAMDIARISQKIISGDIAKITVTIPEGFTVKQIEERLGLKLPGESLEGFLFPDTYQFPLRVSGEGVVKKMRENFDKKLAPYQNEISNVGLTLFDVITMASLIEKEVKTKEEKELAAGILWKRLKIGMPLQVDAEMGTYEYRGLPPAPICNPGIASIKAAIYPKNSEYWYYLSTPEGKTIFSKTLEVHNAARAQYLK